MAILLPGCMPTPDVDRPAKYEKRSEILPATPEIVAEEAARIVARMGAQVIRNDEGLIHSVVMTNLPVRDSVLIPLKVLIDLEVLSLSGTHVTNSGMTHLIDYDRLTYLFMNDTAVTDEGLLTLADNVALRYISLDNTHVTLQGVEAFRKLSPGTVVQHSPRRPESKNSSETGDTPWERTPGEGSAPAIFETGGYSAPEFSQSEQGPQRWEQELSRQSPSATGVRLRYRGENASPANGGNAR